MNICQIYFEKDRTIRHRWFILQDRSDPKQFQKVQGYVKISMTLSHEKDSKMELLPESLEDKAKSKGKWDVEIPASISVKTNQLVINLIRGENLPKLDDFGSDIDAFAQFTLGPVDLKSSTIQSLRPTWNQRLMLPMFVPSFIKNLLMQVWDYDFGRPTDDPVGSIMFPIDAIIKGEYREPLWVHLYGAPLKVEDKEQTLFMHQYPDKGKFLLNSASWYRGSVLLSIEHLDNQKEVVSGVFSQTQQLGVRGGFVDYKVIVDIKSIFAVGNGKDLTEKDDLEIRVSCGIATTSTKSVGYDYSRD